MPSAFARVCYDWQKLIANTGHWKGPTPKMFSLISFLALSFGYVAANVHFCDNTRNQLFYVSSMSLVPENIVAPGDTVRLRLNYTSPVAIADGQSKATVRYHSLPLPPFKQSICELTSCPIAKGPSTLTYSFIYPRGLPGRTVTTIIWHDTNNTVLLCLKVSLKTE